MLEQRWDDLGGNLMYRKTTIRFQGTLRNRQSSSRQRLKSIDSDGHMAIVPERTAWVCAPNRDEDAGLLAILGRPSGAALLILIEAG
jgi:hypothetical protein